MQPTTSSQTDWLHALEEFNSVQILNGIRYKQDTMSVRPAEAAIIINSYVSTWQNQIFDPMFQRDRFMFSWSSQRCADLDFNY